MYFLLFNYSLSIYQMIFQLQQYLEIRAAQFVKALEEQEQRGQLAPQPQALVQHQPQQQHIQHYAVAQPAAHYAPAVAQAGPVYTAVNNQYSVVPNYHQAMYHTTVSHVQQPQYVYSQVAAHGDHTQQSQPVEQQQDDSAYQYEQQGAVEQQQYHQQQDHDEQQYQGQSNEEQQYEKPQTQDEQQYQEEAAPQYQQEPSQQYDQQQQYYSQSGQDDGQYERPQTQTVTKYIYERPPQTHGVAAHSDNGESDGLETHENYPSDTHTQVTFRNHYADSKDYGRQGAQAQYYTPDPHTNYVTQATQSEVSITPKPYNYHAHPITAAPSSRSHSNKRAVPYSEEQFKKINKLINRIRKTKSIVEPKTE
jgi:hypothetical protein